MRARSVPALVCLLIGLAAGATTVRADSQVEVEDAAPTFALGRPARAAAVEEVLSVIFDAPTAHRVALVRALGRSGGAAAAEALGELLADEEEPVRRAALQAVRRWKYNPKVVNGVAVERPGVRQRLKFELDH